MPKKKVTLTLDPDTCVALKRLAAEWALSQSAVVDSLVEEAIAAEPAK